MRVPLLFCAMERLSLHAALSFFLSVSFRSLRFGASNVFVFLRVFLFDSCEHSASAVFCGEFSFSLCFVHLFRTFLS